MIARLIGTANNVWMGGLLKLSNAILIFLLAEKAAKLTTLIVSGEVVLTPSENPKQVTPFDLPEYAVRPLM